MCCYKKCGSKNAININFIKGRQRYKCKDCGYQFVLTGYKGKSYEQKMTAVSLYISWLSLRTIGKLLNVSDVSVLNWTRKYAEQNYEKPEPTEKAVIIELDEMRHFLNLKKQVMDIESICNSKKIIDWECGGRDTKTLNKMLNHLKKWNVEIYFADSWKSYSEIIPKRLLVQSKKETYNIERNNSHQRDWFAHFRRKAMLFLALYK